MKTVGLTQLAGNSIYYSLAIIGCLLFTANCDADTVALVASQDNTLYEDNQSNSNGAGDFIFAGNNGGSSPRRSLLQFDLSSIPTGAIINSASVTLELSQTGAGASDVAFHRLLTSWGESTSDAPGGEGGGTAAATGDATWLHTSFDNQFWTNPGGDFDSAASSTNNVDVLGSQTWTGLAGDVQGWLDGDFGNFGWIIIGDESVAGSSSNRFNSRTNASGVPTLTVDFTVVPEPSTAFVAIAFSPLLLRRRRS